jgi:predicted PurR-regulated permease PerM
MDINSGVALAAVFVGAAIWGAIGALIAIPLAAALVTILDTYWRRHELVPALALQPDTNEIPANPQAATD